MIHTTAWVLWLAAAVAPAVATRNPLYLGLAVLVLLAAYGVLARGGDGDPDPAGAGWGAFLRLGLVLVGFAVLVQPLLVKAGATTLLTLPSVTWRPEAFGRTLAAIELGGRVTLESVVYGASRGLALLAVLLAFATFNVRVDHHQLLRAIPRFLYQSGIVLSIALAFVPQMLVAQREIREAQALRGHRFRGLRDLVPLFVALVAEGLERSLDLAESMEARGFGHAGGGARVSGRAVNAALALALALLLAGAWARTYRPAGGAGWAALGLLLAGIVLLAGALAAVGRRVRRSRFRREPWRRRDTAVAAASGVALGAFVAAAVWGRPPLLYYPYPRLAAPPFDLGLAAALLLLAAPAVVAARSRGSLPAGGPEG